MTRDDNDEWTWEADAAPEPPVPALFKACGDIEFLHHAAVGATGFTRLRIGAGVYGSGAGALFCYEHDGMPHAHITVNLAGVPSEFATRHGALEEDELYVRTDPSGTAQSLLRTGLFTWAPWEVVDVFYDTHTIRDYARLWRFAKCGARCERADQPHTYRVECAAYRAALAQSVEEALAKDSIARLSPRRRRT